MQAATAAGDHCIKPPTSAPPPLPLQVQMMLVERERAIRQILSDISPPTMASQTLDDVDTDSIVAELLAHAPPGTVPRKSPLSKKINGADDGTAGAPGHGGAGAAPSAEKKSGVDSKQIRPSVAVQTTPLQAEGGALSATQLENLCLKYPAVWTEVERCAKKQGKDRTEALEVMALLDRHWLITLDSVAKVSVQHCVSLGIPLGLVTAVKAKLAKERDLSEAEKEEGTRDSEDGQVSENDYESREEGGNRQDRRRRHDADEADDETSTYRRPPHDERRRKRWDDDDRRRSGGRSNAREHGGDVRGAWYSDRRYQRGGGEETRREDSDPKRERGVMGEGSDSAHREKENSSGGAWCGGGRYESAGKHGSGGGEEGGRDGEAALGPNRSYKGGRLGPRPDHRGREPARGRHGTWHEAWDLRGSC